MPKIVDRQARRSEILDTCFELFAKKGYAAIGMRQIAKELGFTTGTLYHYFPGKRAILGELFVLLPQRDIEEIGLELLPGATRQQRFHVLRRFLERRSDSLQKSLQIGLEARRVQPGPETEALLKSTLEAYQSTLSGVLDLPPSFPGEVLLQFILGALIRRILDPAGFSWDRQLDFAEALIQAQGLGPAAGKGAGGMPPG
jgi:AcrR family transcriptional regulator